MFAVRGLWDRVTRVSHAALLCNRIKVLESKRFMQDACGSLDAIDGAKPFRTGPTGAARYC